ncbi:C-type lectin domain family 4 member M-like [Sardina pilchardus]|uniref:C-type lectin domain family 4 member M-like n=1 Tax=Sardina pilchardus TaxID=27697 RepID=UPI002E153D95
MAEEGKYANANPENFHMSPTSQVNSGTQEKIYANEKPCGRPERVTASKPSGAVKNYSRWVTVCLRLLCVLLLALNIGLGIKYFLEKCQLQAEREHLLASHVKITVERDQVLASNTDLTRELDQLLSSNDQLQDRISKLEKRCSSGSNVNISMERDQALASNTNLTRQMDQLLKANDQLQTRISKLEKRCPSGWRYFNTKCYFISSSIRTWSESRQQCKDSGGDLVIINSKEEQVFIYGLEIYRAWIGLVYKQGVWEWMDNTQLSTSYWDQRQPNRDDEDCVLIAADKGETFSSWHDYPCSDKHYFICGIPAYM